jgi:signal transduction histidine kinase/ActR/RegA family two-component response regulator
MGQALKVIKFDSEEKSEGNSSKGGKRSSLSYFLIPLSTAAIITAILGIVSLILEVKIYFQFRYEIYLARLFPTLVSLLTLILLQSKFGKKHHVLMTHLFLISIFSSLGFVGYKISDLYLYNLSAASLFLLTLSLFLYWGKKNQIIAGVYYLLIFGVSAFASDIISNGNNEVFILLASSFITIILSVIISNQRDSLKVGQIKKTKNTKVKNNENGDEQSRGLLEESIIPVFEIKLNGDFDYVNDSMCEVLEASNTDEIYEKNFFKDYVKNEKVENHLLKKLENKGRVENYRFTYSKNDGNNEILIMDCRSKVIDDEVVLEGTIRNITQQFLKDKALLNELEALRQIKRQNSKIIPNFTSKDVHKSNVISKMGHELRTPMNSVLGFLTLIENGLFENEEELKEFSHSAKLSAESLLGLINDVVEIAKIQEGSVEIVKDEFNLDEIIDRITSELSPHLKQNNLKLTTEIADNVPNRIISDQSKYYQLLINLLRNAIQVSESGIISLKVSLKTNDSGNTELVTTVEDTGKGIPDAELQKLLSSNTGMKNDSKITANVLHIMICNELVALLEGELSATSEIGKGTNFSFSFELETSDLIEQENLARPTNEQVNTYSKAKLLLVEDNPISRKVEQKLLQEAGYDVDCVDNASDAIKSVEKGIYNLVLMDIELKDMDGLEATKLVRNLEQPICDIPIIAVTAHSSMKDREKCLVAGMNDYISKPINITFLKMTIDQWLNEARSKSL